MPHVLRYEAATSIKYVETEDLNSVCKKVVGVGDIYLGCYSLISGTCTIYTYPNPAKFILEHEEQHCRGYIH